MGVQVACPGILPDNNIPAYCGGCFVPCLCTDWFFDPRNGIRTGCVNAIDIVIARKTPVVFPNDNSTGNCRFFLIGIRLAGA